ncbi:carbonic anhydrase [Salinisphaera sp. USBA-960]|uniref:carbonic anhydrase n=1 Tax=Salinisphaera orenii TaxID=856731 RepID=UPI0013A655D3|nr:carbonic anhydrase [Salifodinibacter halophilus]NNC26121.1 carbonic anhydrase [Salifodinibacter halophilus]
MNADSALACLKRGNAAFLAGINNPHQANGPANPMPTLEHRPFAVVLACSDARVPIERIFNQGFGELFVIRVAGNVADAAQIASVEYAVAELDVSLVLVLGHTGCGAVSTAVNARQTQTPAPTRALSELLAQINPALDRLEADNDAVPAAVWHNVAYQGERLVSDSELLADRVARHQLRIVGACCETASGHVDFDDAS